MCDLRLWWPRAAVATRHCGWSQDPRSAMAVGELRERGPDSGGDGWDSHPGRPRRPRVLRLLVELGFPRLRGRRAAAPGRSPRVSQACPRHRPAESPEAPRSQRQKEIGLQGRRSRPHHLKAAWASGASKFSQMCRWNWGVTCRPPRSSRSDWSPLEGAPCTPIVRDQQTHPSVFTWLWRCVRWLWKAVLLRQIIYFFY